MDPKDSSDNIIRFKEAIALDELLRLDKEKIKRLKDSKKPLIEMNLYGQEREKLKKTKEVIRSASEVKRQRFDDLNDRVIKEIIIKLVDAADIKGKLNKPLVPSDDMNIDMQPYLQQVNHLKQEIEELNIEKVDKLQLTQEVENYIEQAQTDLQSFYEKSSLNYEPVNAKYTSDLNELNSKIMGYDRNALVDKVLSMLVGEQPSKKEKITSLVYETLRDMFGKELIKLAIRDQSNEENIYPSEVNSLQIRETNSEETTSRLDTMNKEMDKILSVAEDLPKIEHLIGNLGYADHITKNHAEVLNFLNAPDGIANKIPYINEAKDIPPEISLNEQNFNLSTALTASLTQYTKNHFSDLEERLDRLEKESEQ
ncbi:hypothetical protein BDF21DRAFT_413510 [Thamnidium elegans]|uniref:Coiled coil protein n=1 Tax=Thamnidium elegans TaxID=101142 RepID=A0A8H7SMB4_9FUNG|nr:hypothetical protein INT48_006345 [Thamnidium elegans]KAI8088566.1 hypothetical protein BDF21DRAFT_413510 [Thamnidium elegans]